MRRRRIAGAADQALFALILAGDTASYAANALPGIATFGTRSMALPVSIAVLMPPEATGRIAGMA